MRKIIATALMHIAARIVCGWWPDAVLMVPTPPKAVREQLEREFEQNLRKAMADIVKQRGPSLYADDELPPITTVGPEEAN